MKLRTWIIWLAIVVLTVAPFWIASGPPAEPGLEAPAMFGGADERAQQAIGVVAPEYTPWFAPVFEPASGEIASLLFALQAAIGAGVIGFWLGAAVTRERAHKNAAGDSTNAD